MNGKLRNDITQSFRLKFETDCISLLLDGYASLKKRGRDLRGTDENNITAQLVGFMNDNPRRKYLQISVHREHILDSQEVYDGNADANESARIDLKYIVWNSNLEHEYHMEAKNIGQNNWIKPNSNITVDAGRLRRRYLETGVANFTSGRYPYGALIAFVLDGSYTEIVKQLNDLLKQRQRESEYLVKANEYGCDFYYISNHYQSSMAVVKHFFLNFAN